MEVKIKKMCDNAVIPSYSKSGDAGMDLTAVSVNYDDDLDVFTYHTGICIEIPEGYVGLIYPRSSIYKTDLEQTNHVGVVDSGYIGELILKMKILPSYERINIENDEFAELLDSGKAPAFVTYQDMAENRIGYYSIYGIGDRIGQLIIMPYPVIEFVQTDELSETERGDAGFGSTGK